MMTRNKIQRLQKIYKYEVLNGETKMKLSILVQNESYILIGIKKC
jgi:hypothetical protein